jgi:hypothetical protein
VAKATIQRILEGHPICPDKITCCNCWKTEFSNREPHPPNSKSASERCGEACLSKIAFDRATNGELCLILPRFSCYDLQSRPDKTASKFHSNGLIPNSGEHFGQHFLSSFSQTPNQGGWKLKTLRTNVSQA